MDVLSSYAAAGMTPYATAMHPTLSSENPVLESVAVLQLLTMLPLPQPMSDGRGQNLDVYA